MTDRLVAEHLGDALDRRKAYALDPEYHYRVYAFRQTIDRVDRAFEQQGCSEAERRELVDVLVQGLPDPAEALARLKDRDAAVAGAEKDPPRPFWLGGWGVGTDGKEDG